MTDDGATRAATATNVQGSLHSPSDSGGLAERLQSVSFQESHPPTLTTMCNVVGSVEAIIPPNSNLLTTNNLIYEFDKVEADGITPFTVVGIILGPVAKGLAKKDCPVEVVNNKYCVVSFPCPGVLFDVLAITRALNANKFPPILRPDTSRYLGISKAVSGLINRNGKTTNSVFVVELPFRCNQDLFHDGDDFPDLRFLEFTPESDSGESVVFLHVQLRSYRRKVTAPKTASLASSMLSSVSRRGNGHRGHGMAQDACCAHCLCANGGHLALCPDTNMLFCGETCQAQFAAERDCSGQRVLPSIARRNLAACAHCGARNNNLARCPETDREFCDETCQTNYIAEMRQEGGLG